MVNREEVLALADQVLKASAADQTEVVIMAQEKALTRFGDSVIHQNTVESNITLGVRAALGKQVGYAATNQTDAESIRAVVQKAMELARLRPELPGFESFPAPRPVKAAREDGATGVLSPEERANAVRMALERATKHFFTMAGAFSTEAGALAVANTLGVRNYTQNAVASMSAIVMSDQGAGYADMVSADASTIDPVKLAEEATERCIRNRDAIALEPGEYEVVLGEYAVADLLTHTAFCGFGAQALQEGRSFMGGNFGKQIMGANVTIWDDGLDDRGLPLPFDFEGVPRQKVVLVENGIARGVVYDTLTARREGKESTGHAVPAEDAAYGPHPMNLFMQRGESSQAAMIAGIKRGVLVTRLHYLGIVHPMKAVLTGMTRDGTFLIENGKVTRALKNLRFTESMLRAFSNVRAISRETKLQGGMFGSAVAPALQIGNFTFTGSTQ